MCPGSLYRLVPLPAAQHVSKIVLIIDMKAFSLFMFLLLKLLPNKLVKLFIKEESSYYKLCNNV